jgi:hypothetical protein
MGQYLAKAVEVTVAHTCSPASRNGQRSGGALSRLVYPITAP